MQRPDVVVLSEDKLERMHVDRVGVAAGGHDLTVVVLVDVGVDRAVVEQTVEGRVEKVVDDEEERQRGARVGERELRQLKTASEEARVDLSRAAEADRASLEERAESAEARLQRTAREDALQAALDRLPERQRQAVVLRHIDGMANPEIATILDVGVEAVESLTARGKRALAKLLGARRDALGYDDDKT